MFTIGIGIPTRTCIEANAQSFARYAALCREANMVLADHENPQQPALATWHGDDANSAEAQQALNRRAQLNRAARRGKYRSEMESA